MSPVNVDINYPLLRVYAYYRLGLSSLLLLMHSSNLAPNILGKEGSDLFFYTAAGYTLINLLTLTVLWRRRFEPSAEQIFTLLFGDVIALILFIHASGGLGSGLGFLLLVTVAAGAIFLRGQLSFALAAFTTLSILGETLYANSESGAPDARNLFTAGMLGAMVFACALAFNYLSTKLRLSAIEAANQAAHAAHLERLAQLIIERMQTGIVVTNPNGRVELINHSAENLLNWPQNEQEMRLQDIAELEEHVQLWQKHPHSRAPSIKTANSQHEVRLRFARLSGEDSAETVPENNSDTLIFVEDARSLNREAQHLKLASLGRLTASIAHEVRNPLGAISHASQLLGESPELNHADQRLIEIIDTNAARVNQIIENVLQLSRRRATRPEQIDLLSWLRQFIQEYRENNSGELVLNIDQEDPIHTRIDTSHLTQVITNLTDNGLRHSQQAIGEAVITFELGRDSQTQLPYLAVIDEGEGIAEDSLPHVFEPFFTTEATGSGLGLYLSKELCEANHASLNFQRTSDSKSCFRIDFAHPDRMF